MKITYASISLVLAGFGMVAAGVVKVDDGIPSANRSRAHSMVRVADTVCRNDDDCGDHGRCRNSKCVCDEGYITWEDPSPCSYRQESKLTAFLVSFFVGALGIDWFVLSKGSAKYIAAGVGKLILSCGCCAGICSFVGDSLKESVGSICSCISALLSCGSAVWYFVDWIRILANAFPDGNGAPLKPW